MSRVGRPNFLSDSTDCEAFLYARLSYMGARAAELPPIFYVHLGHFSCTPFSALMEVEVRGFDELSNREIIEALGGAKYSNELAGVMATESLLQGLPTGSDAWEAQGPTLLMHLIKPVEVEPVNLPAWTKQHIANTVFLAQQVEVARAMQKGLCLEGLDEACVNRLLELPTSMLATVMEGFRPKPGTLNASGLFMGYVLSASLGDAVNVQTALRRADGLSRAAFAAALQRSVGLGHWDVADVLMKFAADFREILAFAQQHGLDADCVLQLQQQPPSVVKDVITGFQPRPETQDVKNLFMSFLRSVSSTQAGKGKGGHGDSELLDFINLWQLDQACADYLVTQTPEIQKEAIENFRPKPGTANVSGFLAAWVLKKWVGFGLCLHRHELFWDAVRVARAAVWAAPLFLEHWIRLGIVLSHPSLDMSKAAGALVRQALVLNPHHNCLLGMAKVLEIPPRSMPGGEDEQRRRLEAALGGSNASRRTLSNSGQAILLSLRMRDQQRRVREQAVTGATTGAQWLQYARLLTRRGWLIAALGVCMHLEASLLSDARPEALRELSTQVLDETRRCREPLTAALLTKTASHWGADLDAYEQHVPTPNELLSERWLTQQEAKTYDGGLDTKASHMVKVRMSWCPSYQRMLMTGTSSSL
eukprot:g8057.t1